MLLRNRICCEVSRLLIAVCSVLVLAGVALLHAATSWWLVVTVLSAVSWTAIECVCSAFAVEPEDVVVARMNESLRRCGLDVHYDVYSGRLLSSRGGHQRHAGDSGTSSD